MLHGMRAESVELNLYKSCIGLPKFLTITDEQLRKIGIEFPYMRNRILLGLLRFHEKSWSRNSLPIPKRNANIQQYFEVFSNCLKQLVVIQATLKFVEEHNIFAENNVDSSDESIELREEINKELTSLRKNVLQVFRTMQKVRTTFHIHMHVHTKEKCR